MPQPELDFRQYSFDHTTRVLRDVRFADSPYPRFSGMCWSPVPFSRG